MATNPGPIIFTNPGSLKPRRGRSWKRAVKIEAVVRLESQMISDQEIARHLGCTVQNIYQIKNSPEYQAKRLTLLHGVLSIYDRDSLVTDEQKKDAVQEMGQIALIQAKNMLLDRAHPAHAKVVLDLLDRNPATAKITKTQHFLAPATSFSRETERANELLEMLNGLGPSQELPQPLTQTPIFIHESPKQPTTSAFILEMQSKAS